MFRVIRFVAVCLIVAIMAVIIAKAGDDSPTVVYGAAATPDGGQNVFVVEQSKDAPNPLGDPLPPSNVPPKVYSIDDNENVSTNQNNAENSDMSANDSKNLGDDFQNTLMEANGRVYDVQSYPMEDFKAMGNPSNPQTIYSPNVND